MIDTHLGKSPEGIIRGRGLWICRYKGLLGPEESGREPTGTDCKRELSEEER